MKRFGSERGNTLVGFIVGLVVGLAIAVGVAFFITKAPIPFVNKVLRTPDKTDADSKIPDPNKSLYTHDTVPTETTASAPSTIAAPPHPVGAIPGPINAPSAASDAKPPVVDRSRPDIADDKMAFLQAGAYKSADDAENMKAKLALLGFEARVSTSDKDSGQVFRVRLGPYNRVEDMNRVRQRLTENGVDVSVVTLGK